MDKKMQSHSSTNKKAAPASKPAAGMQAKAAPSMAATGKPSGMGKSEHRGK